MSIFSEAAKSTSWHHRKSTPYGLAAKGGNRWAMWKVCIGGKYCWRVSGMLCKSL